MESLSHSLYDNRGFTLIELLVVTTIIIIITAVIFSSQTSFTKSVILSSATYDIALSIHDAQTYGLGTRSTQAAIPNANAGYGLDFKKGTTGSYLLFADSNPPVGSPVNTLCHPAPVINGVSVPTAPNAYPGDCIYTSNDAIIATYQLGNGIKISDFCAYNGTTWACANSHGSTLTQLDFVFVRPNGSPFITTTPPGSYVATPPGPTLTNACIVLSAPGGAYRYITLSSVSQIIASATPCP